MVPQSLSIVIPCYNESSRLPRTLEETYRYFERSGRDVEVIVVSDGSRDNTRDVAEEILRRSTGVFSGRVIEYTPNAGKGNAVRVGMLAAKGARVLFMDADYAVPLEELVPAEAALESGYDIVIGSRALEEANVIERQSFLRERLAKIFGFVQRNYLGLRILDTQCGFKLFTRKAAQTLFTRSKLNSVIFDGEILWLAKNERLRIKELPVQWTHDQDTRIAYTPKKALMVFLDMLRIPILHARSRARR